MNSVTHPKWQYPLREAQALLGRFTWDEESAESQQARAEGSKLYLVLKTFFALPIAKGTVISNYYTVDGFWFQLKLHPNDVAADGNPVHESTTAVSGHHKSQSKATTTFTLYVGHVTPDESYPNWPQPKTLVVKELGLVNANYTRIQAALATLIDAVEAEYVAALPHYQAWVAMQQMPTDVQAQTDYLRQLIRQALRLMPASELLVMPPEPVEVVSAVLEESLAQMDGLRLGGHVTTEENVTLASLEKKANGLIAKIDEMLAEHRETEFNGYDAFDPDNVPDDMDEDATDPDTSAFDDDDPPLESDAEGYFTRRIPAEVEINEADLNGVEIGYPFDHPTHPVTIE